MSYSTDMHVPTKALHWIVGKLVEYDIPYQAVGGLAASAYGYKRSLVDIDLYISFRTSHAFLAAIQDYIIWGPEHYMDAHWDIIYLKIDYYGQPIEIGDSDDARSKKWILQDIDYCVSRQCTVLGCQIYVMPLEQQNRA